MSSRTIYTSTVNVPVYVSWRCNKCDEVNFAQGTVTCSKSTSSSSLRKTKQKTARENAIELARSSWVSEVYHIITDPHNNAESLRANLHMQSTCCSKCKAKAQWDKDTRYIGWMGLAFLPTIIAGIIAFVEMTNVIAWLVFVPFLCIMLYGFYTESSYKSMMRTLPTRYTPVFGSLNEDLRSYAVQMGTNLPTPKDVVEIVINEGVEADSKNVITSSISVDDGFLESTSEEKGVTVSSKQKVVYCRKCGTQLLPNSEYCHKCGTSIVV